MIWALAAVLVAISVTEVVTCTEERWAWDTSEVSSAIMSLKPVSTALENVCMPLLIGKTGTGRVVLYTVLLDVDNTDNDMMAELTTLVSQAQRSSVQVTTSVTEIAALGDA